MTDHQHRSPDEDPPLTGSAPGGPDSLEDPSVDEVRGETDETDGPEEQNLQHGPPDLQGSDDDPASFLNT
ncbi:hypothetical protein J4G33_14475 [Actinotalea sp. BY-33]|uniref:Uncharacterized protein n=1 Tax=Actinotalea soli TaxID=2819234 RepID=A0A939LUN2_9CELL|nr:hypothetical protein [Actinotalea soli]MBO1753015.1 hypothetical protein [Actinotalea soli]